MLLTTLAAEFQSKQTKIQAQIKELQAEEEKVQVELRQMGDREKRMDACLATVREILEDSQQRPQEALIFSAALDDELNSFGFGSLGNNPDEVAELQDKLRRTTEDRDRLLIKIGSAQFDMHEDAKRRIGELEERVTELDTYNCKLEKQYDQINALWFQADKKRGELQVQLDEVLSRQNPAPEPEVASEHPEADSIEPPATEEPEAEQKALDEPQPSSYSQRVQAIATEFFGHVRHVA